MLWQNNVLHSFDARENELLCLSLVGRMLRFDFRLIHLKLNLHLFASALAFYLSFYSQRQLSHSSPKQEWRVRWTHVDEHSNKFSQFSATSSCGYAGMRNANAQQINRHQLKFISFLFDEMIMRDDFRSILICINAWWSHFYAINYDTQSYQ